MHARAALDRSGTNLRFVSARMRHFQSEANYRRSHSTCCMNLLNLYNECQFTEGYTVSSLVNSLVNKYIQI